MREFDWTWSGRGTKARVECRGGNRVVRVVGGSWQLAVGSWGLREPGEPGWVESGGYSAFSAGIHPLPYLTSHTFHTPHSHQIRLKEMCSISTRSYQRCYIMLP